MFDRPETNSHYMGLVLDVKRLWLVAGEKYVTKIFCGLSARLSLYYNQIFTFEIHPKNGSKTEMARFQ